MKNLTPGKILPVMLAFLLAVFFVSSLDFTAAVFVYLLFILGLAWYFFRIKKENLIRIGGVLALTVIIYPLTGATLGAVLGYVFFLVVFRCFTQGRTAFVIALLFLISCPFLLISDQPKMAEDSAVLAYYFLVIGVLQEIAGMILRPREEVKIIHPL